MKSINDWFTPEDWLRLTSDLTDRTIILRQIVVYQDKHGQQLFSVDIPGMLLREAQGTSPYPMLPLHPSMVASTVAPNTMNVTSQPLRTIIIRGSNLLIGM